MNFVVSVPNVGMGEGVKKSKYFVDVIYGWPLGETSSNFRACPVLLESALKVTKGGGGGGRCSKLTSVGS